VRPHRKRLVDRFYERVPAGVGGAYEDIDEAVEATERAGTSKRVVRFLPMGNVKR
jgi:hypothetical protein